MSEKREAFNSHTVTLPSVTSNILSIIFYSSAVSDVLRITRSILLLKGFLPVVKNLLYRMINDGNSKHVLLKQIKKAFSMIQRLFKNHFMDSNIVSTIAAT